MPEVSLRGGARLGWVNASWPLVKLTVDADRLTLSGLGKYEFSPSEVVSIERHGSIPVLASGILINHNRSDYPNKIGFWCLAGREKVLDKIGQSGFVPSGQPVMRPSGMPFRWRVVAAIVVIWNILFLFDGSVYTRQPITPGPLVLAALLGMCMLATATRISSRVQRLVLREGRHVGEVRELSSLTQLVSGLMSLGFGATYFSHVYAG